MGPNFQALVDAGFTITTPMPDEYEAVIDNLTDGELKSLIAIKKKFDDAQEIVGGAQPYTSYFLPF